MEVGSIMIIKTEGRTLDDGGWTPTVVTVTGEDITIEGYTAFDPTGYISISGEVTNLVIDTENRTVTMDGENATDRLYSADYALYVGVGETFFDVQGATSVSISYRNRWQG